MKQKKDLAFEEILSDEWGESPDLREVPLDSKPLRYMRLIFFVIGLAVIARIVALGIFGNSWYANRANANLSQIETVSAPRGLIVDRFGKTLADNQASFSAVLDVREFLKHEELQEPTLASAENILNLNRVDIWASLNGQEPDASAQFPVLSPELTQSQAVALKGLHLPTLLVKDSFKRLYAGGVVFASLLGYTGLPTAKELSRDATLTTQDLVGKGGIEAAYDPLLRGTRGTTLTMRDAKGRNVGETGSVPATIGRTLKLTIDADFQSYFYSRMQQGLRSLGRTSGVGLAMNPQTGEVLAFMNFPSFDNNVLSNAGHNAEKTSVLTSPLEPLFNRAISGLYSPGSTIKPLVGVAALAEGIIDPQRTIFSPGYIDVPNPYVPGSPTRYLDWRYQGDVNMASAIAQSSDVYFYVVGGGTNTQKGLGITKLNDWWKKFNFGSPTGIDLRGEEKGFLPTIGWKERTTGHPWLLGDTYNVSIGQGDLLATPIQLLDYTGAIANGGKIYKPFLNFDTTSSAIADLGQYLPQIKEVDKGMVASVRSPLGTAHTLADLPFSIGAKTGSAQIENNTQENAFFVGYAPTDNPKIAVLVLIEHSKEGSLNAVPIAKDVLAWYYEHRIRK